MKKTLIIGSMLAILSASAVKADELNISGFELNNRLRVIVAPNHKAPIVMQMVCYKVGAVNEDMGKGGTAHLLEHLMFRGTKNIKGRQFDTIMGDNGASINAFTSYDVTCYHEFIDISRLELAMYLEADRMNNLHIEPNDFEIERRIVYQERKQTVENNPLSPWIENVQRIFWQSHPYSRLVAGSESEILGLKQDDVERLYRNYYAPNNVIVVLSGDIDVATAQRLTTKYYGQIEPRPLPQSSDNIAHLPSTFSKFKMQLPNITLPRVLLKFQAPSYNTGSQAVYDYMVLSKYLGEGDVSQLYRQLVMDKKVATSVSSTYDYTRLGGGSLTISAIPEKGTTAEELADKVRAIIGEIATQFTADDLAKTQQQMLAGLIYINDNPKDAAEIFAQLAVGGMSDDEIRHYADNIQKVTVAGVKQAARNLLLATAVEAEVSAKEGAE